MDLPFEVLVYLLKYLPKSDRITASETCRLWYLAANDYCFLKNKYVLFHKSALTGEESSPLRIFERSDISYCNYFFSEVEITNKTNIFWDRIGDNVKCLTFNNCDVCEKVFLYILQRCQYLETLNVNSCRELFMSGRLLEGQTVGLSDNSLENLKSLSLAGNQYLTDALFDRFVKAAPAIQVLDLSKCSVQFHTGLVKRFYPQDHPSPLIPSGSVFTFYFVLLFIVSRASNIKRLLFSKTLLDGAALQDLSEVKGLNLESLYVNSCDQLTNAGILSLSLNQTSLKELDLGMCSRVTDQSLVYICNNLVNLEYLNVQRCRAITDLGVAELFNLKKLKSLNIAQCELITKDGLEKGLCTGENHVLEELDIHSLNLDQNGLIMLSERLPKLHFFDISYCFNGVTDTSVQVIFKNQLLLHTLKMSHCDKVSDAGLTGMGKVDSDDDDTPIMSHFIDQESPQRIYLGSRAEEEIVRDAKRKRDVQHMCEKLTMDTYTGFSLARLKQLRELDISGCNRITDVSLTYAFKFKELLILNMSRCQQITHEGLNHLVTNCPSIEYFNLIDCFNLNDNAVIKVVDKLRRLKQLDLKGCNQLTDNVLEAVNEHCKKLKVLDVQGCRRMTPELACSLNVSTLHTVLVSKPGPYVTDDGVKNRIPSPAFLPSLMRKLLLRRDRVD